MPSNITDASTFTSPIQTVADGDTADAADFALAPQGLANRTKWLYDQIVNGTLSLAALNVAGLSHLDGGARFKASAPGNDTLSGLVDDLATYVPTLSVGSGSVVTSVSNFEYSRIGNLVEFRGHLAYTLGGGAGGVIMTLPYKVYDRKIGGTEGGEQPLGPAYLSISPAALQVGLIVSKNNIGLAATKAFFMLGSDASQALDGLGDGIYHVEFSGRYFTADAF